MSRNRKNASVEEMERIQRGLEAFLEQEVWNRKTEDANGFESDRNGNRVRSIGSEGRANREKSMGRKKGTNRHRKLGKNKVTDRGPK